MRSVSSHEPWCDKLSLSRLIIGSADVELWATAPPLERGRFWILCHMEVGKKHGQLVLRLLNSTVLICPEGEFGLSPLSSIPPETGADSRGDLSTYIFILATLGETDVRQRPGTGSVSAALFLFCWLSFFFFFNWSCVLLESQSQKIKR